MKLLCEVCRLRRKKDILFNSLIIASGKLVETVSFSNFPCAVKKKLDEVTFNLFFSDCFWQGLSIQGKFRPRLFPAADDWDAEAKRDYRKKNCESHRRWIRGSNFNVCCLLSMEMVKYSTSKSFGKLKSRITICRSYNLATLLSNLKWPSLLKELNCKIAKWYPTNWNTSLQKEEIFFSWHLRED